jgi:hypothetical protein
VVGPGIDHRFFNCPRGTVIFVRIQTCSSVDRFAATHVRSSFKQRLRGPESEEVTPDRAVPA